MPFAFYNRFVVEMPQEAAEQCSHQGDCAADVESWVPRLTRPPDCTPERLAAELREYGAWDGDELADDAANWERMVWIAAGDILEEQRSADR